MTTPISTTSSTGMITSYPGVFRMTHADVKSLLELQKKNLLTDTTGKSGGFLSAEFSEEDFNKMNIPPSGVYVKKNQSGQIIGYLVVSADEEHNKRTPIIKTMMEQLPPEIDPAKCFVYGPVCIDMQYRGLNILQELVVAARKDQLNNPKTLVLFISNLNKASLTAHHKLGAKKVGGFEFKNGSFDILVFAPMRSKL